MNTQGQMISIILQCGSMYENKSGSYLVHLALIPKVKSISKQKTALLDLHHTPHKAYNSQLLGQYPDQNPI